MSTPLARGPMLVSSVGANAGGSRAASMREARSPTNNSGPPQACKQQPYLALEAQSREDCCLYHGVKVRGEYDPALHRKGRKQWKCIISTLRQKAEDSSSGEAWPCQKRCPGKGGTECWMASTTEQTPNDCTRENMAGPSTGCTHESTAGPSLGCVESSGKERPMRQVWTRADLAGVQQVCQEVKGDGEHSALQRSQALPQDKEWKEAPAKSNTMAGSCQERRDGPSTLQRFRCPRDAGVGSGLLSGQAA